MSNQLNFEIEDRDSHTYMKVEGAYEFDAFIELIKAVNKVGSKSESKKVICDIRQVEILLSSDTDRFRIGTAMADTIAYNIHIAGLVAPESINHFVELVANNRGVHFKVFSCANAAREWLLEEDVLAKNRFD